MPFKDSNLDSGTTVEKPMKSCVLCGFERIQIVDTLFAQQLIADWRKAFDIDITSELKGYTHIHRYRCHDCELEFFPPELVGSPRLYSELQRFHWYYMPHKWEYSIAIQDIQKGERVLEVGCGRGDFFEKLINEKQVDGFGIELNPNAVSEAQKLGRPVCRKDLQEITDEQPGTFDVVCSFQVLEHIPDPKKFINACAKLLKPGGRLIIAVPNSDSFIRLDNNNLLNQTPHHITRWARATFEALPQCFPLVLLKVGYEPLASYHLDWYVNLQLRRLLPLRLLRGFVHRFVRILLLPLRRQTGWYHFLRGHTIYVLYRKV